MRFELLGPLQVLEGGAPIDLGGPRQRRVLAVILAAAPDDVSTSRLVDEVWESDPPATANHVIRTYVSNLKSALGGRIESDGSRYRLVMDGDESDAAELEDAVQKARVLVEVDPLAAWQRLDEIRTLRRGHPFEGVGEDSLVVRIRADELDEQWMQATELRMEAALRIGMHRSIVGELETLVRSHPFRERFAGQLMMALYRSERQAEALAVYRKLRERLVEELGLDPSPTLRDLEERILLQDPALDLHPPHNLPTPVSSFVGRVGEIEVAKAAVEGTRLVTLVGVGGVGKTRLAEQTARALLDRFRDGVWWIELASIHNGDALLPTVAAVLGLAEQPGLPLDRLFRRYLSNRDVLFVMDNCEHLADAAGVTAVALLDSGPGVKVLATSRRPLGVAGEARVQIDPMSLPDADRARVGMSDAEQLFAIRSREAGAVLVSEASSVAVARVCVRLDGIPLAIEMAAAQSRVMTPGQIAEMLERGDTGVLASRDVDRDPRQATLTAVLQWSYDLLTSTEQAVFVRISVFLGRFDLDAIEAVAAFDPVADVVDAVTSLVDASLLTATRTEAGVSFRMLQTVRDFASARLAETSLGDEVSRRHAHHLLELLVDAGRLRMTREFAAVAGRLDEARGDVQVALDWLLVHEPERAIEAAAGLAEYWSRRGDSALAYRYGRRMLEAASDASTVLRADGLLCASFGAALSGDFEFAASGPVEALELAREAGWQTRLWAMHALGNISLILGDLDTVEAMGRDIRDLCESEGLVLPRAYGSAMLGYVAFFRDLDPVAAGRFLDDAIEGMRGLGDFGGMKIYGLVTAMSAAAERGDFEAAERYAAEAVSIPGAAQWTAAAYIVFAGWALFPQGVWDRAGKVLARGVRMSYETGGEVWMRTGFLFLAYLAAVAERWEPSARFYGACRANLPSWARDPRFWEPESVVRDRLGEATYERLCDGGRQATTETVLGWIDAVVD